MTTQTQEKASRMCDAALEHIQGVADDLGFPEALRVFQAQVAAFAWLAGQEYGSSIIGAGCAAVTAESVCTALAKDATS